MDRFLNRRTLGGGRAGTAAPTASEVIGLPANSCFQRLGAGSPIRSAGWFWIRCSTSTSQAEGSTPCIRQVAIRLSAMPTSAAPGPVQENSQFFRPGLIRRSALSISLVSIGTSGSDRNARSSALRPAAQLAAFRIGCFGAGDGSAGTSPHQAKNRSAAAALSVARARSRSGLGASLIRASIPQISPISDSARPTSRSCLQRCSSKLRLACDQQPAWRMVELRREAKADQAAQPSSVGVPSKPPRMAGTLEWARLSAKSNTTSPCSPSTGSSIRCRAGPAPGCSRP